MVEREAEFLDLIDVESMTETCDAWNNYATTVSLVQSDSGI